MIKLVTAKCEFPVVSGIRVTMKLVPDHEAQAASLKFVQRTMNGKIHGVSKVFSQPKIESNVKTRLQVQEKSFDLFASDSSKSAILSNAIDYSKMSKNQ